MPLYSFGSGVLLGARNDVALNTSTPYNFGLVQDVTLDLSFTVKELYGQYQFALAIARGIGKFTGKAKLAKISAGAFNALFFGQTLAAGQTATSYLEGPTAIPTTPFQITAVNTATFVDDFGVYYSNGVKAGQPLTKVAAGPAAGQYSVSGAGVYTFASADNASGYSVQLSYTYTIAGTGENIAINNQLLGTTPTFQAVLYSTFQGNPYTLKLYSCTSSKLAFGTKLEDFVMPEIDFSIFANAAQQVGLMSVATE
jgi:hypothetical protein